MYFLIYDETCEITEKDCTFTRRTWKTGTKKLFNNTSKFYLYNFYENNNLSILTQLRLWLSIFTVIVKQEWIKVFNLLNCLTHKSINTSFTETMTDTFLPFMERIKWNKHLAMICFRNSMLEAHCSERPHSESQWVLLCCFCGSVQAPVKHSPERRHFVRSFPRNSPLLGSAEETTFFMYGHVDGGGRARGGGENTFVPAYQRGGCDPRHVEQSPERFIEAQRRTVPHCTWKHACFQNNKNKCDRGQRMRTLAIGQRWTYVVL